MIKCYKLHKGDMDDYLKHIVNKFLDGAFPVIVLLVAVEVQVKPVSKFNLEANSHNIFPFLFWYINDKATEKKLFLH